MKTLLLMLLLSAPALAWDIRSNPSVSISSYPSTQNVPATVSVTAGTGQYLYITNMYAVHYASAALTGVPNSNTCTITGLESQTITYPIDTVAAIGTTRFYQLTPRGVPVKCATPACTVAATCAATTNVRWLLNMNYYTE